MKTKCERRQRNLLASTILPRLLLPRVRKRMTKSAARNAKFIPRNWCAARTTKSWSYGSRAFVLALHGAQNGWDIARRRSWAIAGRRHRRTLRVAGSLQIWTDGSAARLMHGESGTGRIVESREVVVV